MRRWDNRLDRGGFAGWDRTLVVALRPTLRTVLSLGAIETVRVTSAVSVNRSVEEAFDYVSRIENNPYWHRRALNTWRLTEDPLGPGSVWHATVRIVGLRLIRRLEFRVVDYQLNRRFFSWTSSVRLPFGTGAEFEVDGSHARVTCIREMRLQGWQNLLRPIVAFLLQKEIEREARDLKDELEQYC